MERNERGYYERNYGSFYRPIPLSQGVNAENAEVRARPSPTNDRSAGGI